jgi:SAM-dependent methyltransferase
LCCPRCRGDLLASGADLACAACGQVFPVSDGLPMLFWPSDDADAQRDVTTIVKEFYEETPFPNYDDFDSVASLERKARQGIFARMLDEQVPTGVRIIECGCGTGQLSSFLSIHNRTVFATDICENSLRLGQSFARQHDLGRVCFLQMNLFRPAFKPESFDLVISNGVLLTTPDPFAGFRSIAGLVRPGGYILIGLYHRYGRWITDARRMLFRLTGNRLLFLDPNLRNKDHSEARKRAWFKDQYAHPHETKHTVGEILGWLEKTGFSFVRSIPRSKPFQPFSPQDRLFEPEEPGNSFERFLVGLGMMFRGSREGGFFSVIARKKGAETHVPEGAPHEPATPQASRDG